MRLTFLYFGQTEFPGKFLLSYQPNTKAFHEYITVTPEGYRYRSNNFKSINALFKWFKAHFNDRSTFPRTPGPATPVSASPYMSQRTPIAQASPYVNSAKPFTPTSNINAQAIQRAAAAMPSHLFNTLSQVAGQTPQFNSAFGQTPLSGGAAGNAAGNFAVPARPGMFPPSTPSSQIASARHSFQPQSMMPPPPPSMPPPGRPGSRSGNQWADIVQQDWQLPNSQSGRARSHVPPVGKPRTPAYSTPGASSSMSISPQQEETPNIRGDQTPLFDEWTSY